MFKKIFCGAFVSISDIPDTNDNPRSGKYQMCPLTADAFQKQVVHKQLVQIQIVKSNVFRKQVWEVSYTKEAYTVGITADEYQSLKK